MLPLQIPGGPELIILFLVYGLMGLAPLVLAAAAIYLLYRLRQDTKSMATSLERIAASQEAGREAVAGEDLVDGDVAPETE